MSFRLRRGTDSERQSVVFAEGELAYTTDSKELYVGDGTTLGGIKITGSVEVSPIALTRNLDLNTFDITGAGDISISGMVTANAFYGNGANLTNLPLLDVNNGATYQINIMGADSSILVNSDTSQLQGELVGNVIGNVAGDVTGNVAGDLTGSVFNSMDETVIDSESKYFFGGVYSSDGSPIIENETKTLYGTLIGDVQGSDSTLIVNSITGDITAAVVNASSIEVLGTVNCKDAFNISSTGRSELTFSKTSALDISESSEFLGTIYFQRDDVNGIKSPSIIIGGNSGVYIAHNITGVLIEEDYVSFTSGGLGVGTYFPSAKLDIRGDIVATGPITPGVYADATARDVAIATPLAGMMVFNTALQKFQGYVSDTGLAGGGSSNSTPGWINLN